MHSIMIRFLSLHGCTLKLAFQCSWNALYTFNPSERDERFEISVEFVPNLEFRVPSV